MKNQYFGDINDYRKYGLLRVLSGGGRARIFVCWMLTANDGTSDGKSTGYLNQPQRWQPLDPLLFDALFEAVIRKGKRTVNVVERESLISSAAYYSRLLREENRADYFEALSSKAIGAELIFFDPDNGMEVRSVPRGRPGSRKYLYWEEASYFFSQGHSLLIYQHFPREKRETYVTLMSKEFRTRTGVKLLYSLQTSTVVFFLLLHPLHGKLFLSGVEAVKRLWGDEFTIRKHLK